MWPLLKRGPTAFKSREAARSAFTNIPGLPPADNATGRCGTSLFEHGLRYISANGPPQRLTSTSTIHATLTTYLEPLPMDNAISIPEGWNYRGQVNQSETVRPWCSVRPQPIPITSNFHLPALVAFLIFYLHMIPNLSPPHA